LRDATQLTTDDVCSWIQVWVPYFIFYFLIFIAVLFPPLQKQYVGEVNPAFIRALVTAVTESSIEGEEFFLLIVE
jgi:hypothetical protein